MTAIRVGYVPLLDAAPLFVARELGFAAEERIELAPVRLGSWAQSRDMLGAGRVDAAHMLMPIPIGQALGLGPQLPQMDLVMFLSQGGQVVAISNDLTARLRDTGYAFDLRDAALAGRALRAVADAPLRIGVPFHLSTHLELTQMWMEGCGFAADQLCLITVPPPMMAEAIAAGEVDMFCVGEPWASVAVDMGVANIFLPGTAIWSAPPEKGLVLRRDFTEARPDETGRLMRALWRAGRWLDDPEHRAVAAEILSREEYLQLPSELLERALQGHLRLSGQGEFRDVNGFLSFNRGGANFPWKSCAALIARRLALRHGLDPMGAMQRAMAHFRTDLYRQHLRPAGAGLPGASMRVEGAIARDRIVAAERGEMMLRADSFFDGSVFEPPVIRTS